MKMHILTENRARKRGLLAEHGLSVFIEHEDMNVLFDTGQSDVFRKNAALLGIDLLKTDSVVLSHGHYDHCDGLPFFPQTDRFPKVYVHHDAFLRRYAENADGKTYREVGITWCDEKQKRIKDSLVLTDKSAVLAPGITLLGEIPYTSEFEEPPEGLFTGTENDRKADRMNDEQMLIFERENGLCIFLGCSHPGIINCINAAMKQFPGRKIDTLVAGMHLEGVSQKRLKLTIQSLKDMDIKRVVPLHCTGIFAICEMKRALKERCLALSSGESLEF